MPGYMVTLGETVTFEITSETEEEAIDKGWELMTEEDDWKNRDYVFLGIQDDD